MIGRLVTLKFEPHLVDEFLATFHLFQNQIKSMPGCIHLDLLRDTEDINTFSTYSIWKSEEHLNNYRSSELFGKVWPKTKLLFSDRPMATTYSLEVSTTFPQED